jgi:uncharacterized protein YecA (UPF0149 family)
MGVLADSVVAYAQPLLDETDGSPAEMEKALTLAQVCWNLALLPDDERDAEIAEMRSTLKMDESAFQDFRDSVVMPMIRRHHEMYPRMPRLRPATRAGAPQGPAVKPVPPTNPGKYPGTGRNAPCPCKSGKKYKLCCGR